MSKLITQMSTEPNKGSGENDYKVVCTGCYRRCVLYYLAVVEPLPMTYTFNYAPVQCPLPEQE